MDRNDTLASILIGGSDVRRIGKVLSREGVRGTGLIAAGQLAANWVHRWSLTPYPDLHRWLQHQKQVLGCLGVCLPLDGGVELT